MKKPLYEKLIAHVNRKDWWHVPPLDPGAYSKRGKLYASTYMEAEFYGRPNDSPERTRIERPLVGDERAISTALATPPQRRGMTLEEIADHDARWRSAALARGYDSILLMSAKGFSKFRASGRLPRSTELNVLNTTVNGEGQADASNTADERQGHKMSPHLIEERRK